MKPPLANTDAAATISIIGGVIRISAALVHGAPGFVFRRHLAVSLICISMSKVEIAINFAVQATARLCVSALKIVAEGDYLCTAVTTATPYSAAGFGRTGNAKHDEASESLIADINKFSRHGSLHEGLPVKWRPSVPALGRCALKDNTKCV